MLEASMVECWHFDMQDSHHHHARFLHTVLFITNNHACSHFPLPPVIQRIYFFLLSSASALALALFSRTPTYLASDLAALNLR